MRVRACRSAIRNFFFTGPLHHLPTPPSFLALCIINRYRYIGSAGHTVKMKKLAETVRNSPVMIRKKIAGQHHGYSVAAQHESKRFLHLSVCVCVCGTRIKASFELLCFMGVFSLHSRRLTFRRGVILACEVESTSTSGQALQLLPNVVCTFCGGRNG